MNNNQGFRIATIRGIELRLHVSLIFLLIYIVFIASARFPDVASQAGIDSILLVGSPVIWGFLFAIGLFASIVLHELGHAFVAQSAQVKVRSITLMMLGGISDIERIPERPYFEFKLAIVGPLVSFAIAGLLYLVQHNTKSPTLTFFSYWLSSANLALGIFNLIPAFPLDGGRALRSALAVTKGPFRATQISVNISKAFALFFGIIGLLGFNLILMLIAVFIYITAQNELFVLLSKSLLRGISAGEAMQRVEPIQDIALLSFAVEQMLRTKNTILPVITSSETPAVIGLAQINDIPKELWNSKRVQDVMIEVPRVLDVTDSLEQALPELIATPGSALPVRENRNIVGVIKYSGLSELLQLRSLEGRLPLDSKSDSKRAA